ncbi:CidA/LrgA family protein [Tepidimicrobium xylanilyticum]|uniref:CidA/LrgA family protein n=1 Tax=Tepidimicrobium xylanilyticum TaxID=1123352 RepID=UPI0026522DC7|nr:CidA/LrgA family protein [Tepidimicrobium xylanilyticum]GMG96451.1 CidA/LrgA family protein [Tepidimicrobium xylanilyticum]
MKTLKQFSLILIILFIAQILQQRYSLPIPGTILGMMILLLLLITRIMKLERVEKVSNVLLEHLTLFFVPSVVGIMNLFDKVKDVWIYLFITLLTSTMVVIAVTGLTVQILDKYRVNKEKRGA